MMIIITWGDLDNPGNEFISSFILCLHDMKRSHSIPIRLMDTAEGPLDH